MTRFDVAVVGGGINGCFTALAAARAGLRTVLLERERLGGDRATLRSGGLVRLHYPTAAEAWLALEGRRVYAAGGLGFVRTGFLRFAGEGEALAETVAMLRELGTDSRVVEADEIRSIDPGLSVGDGEQAAYEPASGYADPASTMAAVVSDVRAARIDVREGCPARRLLPGEGVETTQGVAEAEQVVLAAGPWSRRLAETAGLELSIATTAIHVVRASGVSVQTTVIDPPNGLYFRPDGDGRMLFGRRTVRDLAMESPDAEVPAPAEGFAPDALAWVARRLPRAAEGAIAGWHAGLLDMTPDGRPLLGPAGPDGLWLACGWSGTGFKSAPAAGAALVHWMRAGSPPHPSLDALRPARSFADATVRSPH